MKLFDGKTRLCNKSLQLIATVKIATNLFSNLLSDTPAPETVEQGQVAGRGRVAVRALVAVRVAAQVAGRVRACFPTL